MAARSWPADLSAAWAGYADALARLPGCAAEAEALRREVPPESPDAWHDAAAVAAWAKFRPHRLLARKSRTARGGALNRLLGGPVAVWAAPEPSLLAQLDHLATLAAALDVTLAALAVTDSAVRLGRLGESVEPWPPAPDRGPDDWASLRDHFFAGVPGLPVSTREALAVRVVPGGDFEDRLAAEGPSPELGFYYGELCRAGPGGGCGRGSTL